jgi:hypothetical protein
MRRTHQYLLLLCFSAVLSSGCYKDKGNYDYKEINQVAITADVPDQVSVSIQDTLRINIMLAPSLSSAAGYEYDWTLYQNIGAPLERWTLGTTQNLKAQITQVPGQYVLDYFVKDKGTGVSFRKKFIVNIVSKFNEGWLLLEEAGGTCDLAMVAPNDAIFKNIYSSANAKEKLPAGSHRVTVVRDRLGVQKIYIMSPNELTQPYHVDFLKVAGFDGQFWGPPSEKKPQEYFIGGSSNELLINNGYPHGMNTLVPAPYKLGLQAPGTWDVAPYEMYSTARGFMLYDKLSQRYYRYNLTDMSPFPAPPANAVFNVNNVGKKMLFTGPTTGNNTYFSVFKNNNDDSLFVYKLDAGAVQPAVDTAYIPNTKAPGLLTATNFISSKLLPHLYYVSGNVVYLLDIPARQARVVYSFPSGTVVTAMKMYINTKNGNDPDNNRLIGIATTEGGAGKFYTFPIGATGDFTGNTYRKVFTGFGKINDLVFKSAP